MTADPLLPAKFRVKVRCDANDLNAMVEVISISQSEARRFALRQFFQSEGWRIIDCEKVKRDG